MEPPRFAQTSGITFFAAVTSRVAPNPGGAGALSILHSGAGAWGGSGWALGQRQEKLLAWWVLGSQAVGTAVARCGSRLRLHHAIGDKRLSSYCQTRGEGGGAAIHTTQNEFPAQSCSAVSHHATAKVSGKERAGRGSASPSLPLARTEPGAMAERRAGTKGRRLGSSRRKQLRESSCEAPAAAPGPSEEPPWASEIVKRVQDFFREQDKDQAGFVTRSDMKVRDGEVFSGQRPAGWKEVDDGQGFSLDLLCS